MTLCHPNRNYRIRGNWTIFITKRPNSTIMPKTKVYWCHIVWYILHPQGWMKFSTFIFQASFCGKDSKHWRRANSKRGKDLVLLLWQNNKVYWYVLCNISYTLKSERKFQLSAFKLSSVVKLCRLQAGSLALTPRFILQKSPKVLTQGIVMHQHLLYRKYRVLSSGCSLDNDVNVSS